MKCWKFKTGIIRSKGWLHTFFTNHHCRTKGREEPGGGSHVKEKRWKGRLKQKRDDPLTFHLCRCMKTLLYFCIHRADSSSVFRFPWSLPSSLFPLSACTSGYACSVMAEEKRRGIGGKRLVWAPPPETPETPPQVSLISLPYPMALLQMNLPAPSFLSMKCSTAIRISTFVFGFTFLSD